ncbi:DUF2993 domain-containing protein [Streptomyces sp. HNM0574]|uniref:LmeA family phospholipid-binding protein n=1 Tax=Streptomyces sp. HNM0574 TaxID=2714954 RepID=UPI001F0DF7EE|nr:DUF2993 domain-containing protein [Streptomyces sp. HNM0574]
MASPEAADPHEPPRPNPYEELAAGPGPEPYDTPRAGAYDGPRDGDTGPLDVVGAALRSDYDEPEQEESAARDRLVRRRRRSRLRRGVKVGVALVVLLAFLAVGDRWAALYAENKAAEQIQKAAKLHAEPEVHIRGFPFLTQLASERLDSVDVAIPDMPAGRISVAQVKGTVEDVKIVGDGPTSIKGAVLGRMQGDVLLDFDDLDRELGTSQVKFTHGGANTVMADGRLPVAGKEVRVKARAQVERMSDHGVGTTVDRMSIEVPGLFAYVPGEDGGLRLARPMAERIQRDAEKAKALFRVGSVAERFGLTPEHAQRVRSSEAELARVTGQPKFLDRLMRVNMLDVALEHPWLLEKVGIDPSVVDGIKNLRVPKLADKLSLAVKLPEMPGDVRLKRIEVEKEGIRAKMTGAGIPFGEAAK